MILDDIYKKCFLIGALRAVIFRHIFSACYSSSEKESFIELENMAESVSGISIITDSLGLQIVETDIFSSLAEQIRNACECPKNDVRFFDFFIKSSAIEDKLRKKIHDNYGTKAAFSYELSQFLALSRFFANGVYEHDINRVPLNRRNLISDEIASCVEFIKFFGVFIRDEISSIKGILPNLSNDFIKLSQIINPEKTSYSLSLLKKWSNEIYEGTSPLINQLIYQYPEIVDRTNRTKELADQLKACKIGIKGWKDYENICLKLLRYLFIPPFKEVKVQVRSEGNKERRDAIIPNNQHEGFWQNIRNEFDCKHIVCEFKNGITGNTKNALNQLRIYLSKPTVGRFGLLFTRERPSKSVIQAQRDAYEQSKILILILDDEKLIKLMKYRAYLGSVDDFLSNEKFEFEIDY